MRLSDTDVPLRIKPSARNLFLWLVHLRGLRGHATDDATIRRCRSRSWYRQGPPITVVDANGDPIALKLIEDPAAGRQSSTQLPLAGDFIIYEAGFDASRSRAWGSPLNPARDARRRLGGEAERGTPGDAGSSVDHDRLA
jgi:hypothetical protein